MSAQEGQVKRSSKPYFIQEIGEIVHLTPREIDCLKELLLGKTTIECSQALDLSPRTIEFYISNIKKKLKCRTRKELIERVRNNHLFDE